MKKLLERFKDCNVFSLSEKFSYLDSVSGQFLYYYLSEEEANVVQKKLEDETYSRLKALYKKEKLKYDFDVLYNDILTECKELNERLIIDRVIEGKTRYKNEGPILIMYRDINDMLFIEKSFCELVNKGKVNNVCELFGSFEYAALENNIAFSEVKFNNHASIGPLFRTYYFNLNEETREWLLLRRDRFDFRDELQDLALFIDDKIVYSSCSREQSETFYRVVKRKGELSKLQELKKKKTSKTTKTKSKPVEKKKTTKKR